MNGANTGSNNSNSGTSASANIAAFTTNPHGSANPATVVGGAGGNTADLSHPIAVRQQAAILSGVGGLEYAGAPRRSGRRRSGGGGGKRRPPVQSSIPSARDLLYVLFKHRVKAAVVAATIFTLAFLAALMLPSKYMSEAQLLVRLGRENLPNSTVAGGPQNTMMMDQSAVVNSEAQIFRSTEIVAETVRRVGPEAILHNAPAKPHETSMASVAVAPDYEPTQSEALAQRMLMEKIEVHTEPLSSVIKVDYECSNPETARAVVQAYVDSYLDHRSRIYAGGRANDLFSGLTAESEQRLRQIEEQIKQLKDQTGVSDVTAQKQFLLSRIATIQGNLDTVNAQLAASTSKITSLETQLWATPKEIALSRTTNAPMGVVSVAQQELNKLKAEYDAKSANYLPTSPTITALKEQITSAEQRLADLQKTHEGELLGINPTWAELDKQLASERTNKEGLDAQLRTLNADLEKVKAGQNLINDVELRMSQLARQQGMVDDELKKVLEGRNFSTIDEAMSKDRVGSVAMTQSATLASKPSSPNRKLMLVFGLFAALVGGCGTALLSEMLDQTVGRPEDLKRLGFTRIVSIPLLRMSGSSSANGEAGGGESMVGPMSPETQAIVDLTEHGAADAPATGVDRLRPTRYVRSTSRQLRVVTGQPADLNANLSPREVLQRLQHTPTPAAPAKPQAVATATINAPTSECPLVLNPPASRPQLSPRFMEACHALLERLVFSPVATGEFPMPRSIAVVGITPGQGVSTLATHLAAALADHLPNGDTEQSDAGRVLLVDANLASPAAHRLLDIQNEPGISEWIKQPTDEPTLGDQVRSASIPKLDVLTAGAASIGHTPGRWAEAATMSLESGYHCVIFDLPPMAHAEATARVAGACDAALLVVEGGHVNREVVRQAVHRLAESGVRLLGVVLNKRTYPIPEKLYRWI